MRVPRQETKVATKETKVELRVYIVASIEHCMSPQEAFAALRECVYIVARIEYRVCTDRVCTLQYIYACI